MSFNPSVPGEQLPVVARLGGLTTAEQGDRIAVALQLAVRSHEGHRTAAAQLALQANADPWLGHTTIDGVGQLVRELSPYDEDLDWSDLVEPDSVLAVLPSLGRATARAHCVSDATSDDTLVPFHVEEVVAKAVAADREGFVRWMVAFGVGYAQVVRQDHQLFVDLFRNGRDLGL